MEVPKFIHQHGASFGHKTLVYKNKFNLIFIGFGRSPWCLDQNRPISIVHDDGLACTFRAEEIIKLALFENRCNSFGQLS